MTGILVAKGSLYNDQCHNSLLGGSRVGFGKVEKLFAI